MSLSDFIIERLDASVPPDINLRPGSLQTCVFDIGLLDTNIVNAALNEAVQREYIESFAIVKKNGDVGNFVSIVATTSALNLFNNTFKLGERPEWYGSVRANWPNWAKNEDGYSLSRWLGVDDDI